MEGELRYDLEVEEDRLGDRLDREITALAAPDGWIPP